MIVRPLLCTISLLLSFAAPALAAPATRHHNLQVRLLPAEQMLQGTDRLTVRTDGAKRLLFSLTPAAEILGVAAGGRELSSNFRHGRLTVELPSASRGEVVVEIRYRARFADPAPVRPVSTEDPSYGVEGTIGSRGAFLGGGAAWYPEIPGSLPTVRLEIEMPAEMAAVSAGRLVKASPGRAVWESSRPVRGLALAAGPYRRHERQAGEVPVFAFFYPQSDELAGTYLKSTLEYLTLYQGLFGPYPFEKFAVAENFFPTGYGFPSWTLLGSSVIRLPFIAGTSLGHEVAHSWWGNGVWVDERSGNWSEGLTTYVADYLYKERESPAEAREYRLKILRDYATLVSPEGDFPLREFTSRSTAATQAVGYGKAAMVFHMARRRAGEEAFWGGLRTVAREKLFRPAAWHDFAAAIGAAGEVPMTDYFRQWVDRPGAPVLSLGGIRQQRTTDGWEVSGTLRQRPPFYDLRVPVRLETASGIEEAVVGLQGAEASFHFRTASAPRRLLADPEADLFRRLEATEIPPAVNGVRGSESLLVVTAADLPPALLEPARVLLAAMGQKNAKVIAENRLGPAELQKHDLLFIGLPSRRDLLPPLPAGLAVTAKGFTLEGKEYAGVETALFAALPHPADPGRVAALFLAGSTAAAETAAPKIPHYGKYSYLAFAAGSNVAKGIWPVTISPLIHEFSGGNE